MTFPAFIDVPKPGEIVQTRQAIQIVDQYCRIDLRDRIIRVIDELPEAWVFDGCSCWFNEWSGDPLYKPCFLHDCAYLVGGPDYLRLIADAQLMVDVADMLRDDTMAQIMFAGVRAGGHDAWGHGLKQPQA